MLKNYLKVAIRNIYKNKIYSFINVIGLAVGLAGFILITILIKNELSYDTFHKQSDRIYRVVEIQNQDNIGKIKVAVTMGPLAKAMKDYFAGVENSARMVPSPPIFCKIGVKGFYEKDVSFADPSVFDVLTIPFIEGNQKTALVSPFSIVLTKSAANKYFGNEDPLGKTLTISGIFGTEDYNITGVIKDYPKNSNMSFTMLGSYSTMEHYVSWIKQWNNNTLATFVLLKPGVSPEQIDRQFKAFIKQYIPPDPQTGKQSDLQMYLQPIKDLHLYSSDIVYQTYRNNQGSISTVYIFSAIAFFILLIGCINFMNLATARSAKRIKEIGLRKVMGSDRKSLVYQFIGEAILISFFALLISIILVEVMLPYFKDIFDGRIIMSFQNNSIFLLELVGITLFVGIVSGIYPALFLSRFQPAESLKGSLSTKFKGAYLRKVLVISQFAIAIILFICTGIVSNQMSYIKNKDLGFNKEHVLYLPIRSKDTREKINLLKTELSKNSDIVNVAATSGLFGASGSEGTETVAGTNSQVRMMMRRSFVDYDYLKTMQMDIVKGRNFSLSHSSDSTSAVIINEAAARKFGWANPVGKQFEGTPNKTVIGVVKDFNFFSLHSKIGPLIMSINPDQFYYLMIRVKPENLPATISFINKTWAGVVPDKPFDYSFLDQHFNEIYKNDERTGQMFGFFSTLAILIACLGLFGLAAYTGEQRIKEIGVRKVLGASVTNIVFLISKDFIKLVIISGIIAVPISYFAMNSWLQDFAYRVKIGPVIFILAISLAFLIAFITISSQALKAATSNPVKAIKYE
jgi:ABC-type antimicrobial peptide transport system permease subunit